MRKFSASHAITGNGLTIERPLITTTDEGLILSVTSYPEGSATDADVEYHDGIIVPGFINCHCHLELSHMKGAIPRGTGLPAFIEHVRNYRPGDAETIVSAAAQADNDMNMNGIVACADICNNELSFPVKKKSRIRYHSLIEVFGIDQSKAAKRLEEAERVVAEASALDLPFSVVPHSFYSVSLPLLRGLRRKYGNNKLTSVHFMESPSEKDFIETRSGLLMESYQASGLLPSQPETVSDHVSAVLEEISPEGRLILVHNTFADSETLKRLSVRENLFYCLCPLSNLYISGTLPPVEVFMSEKCDIVLGTDSLSSNSGLSILEELKTLQEAYPSIPLEELISWATYNGARALGIDDMFGTIEPGRKPGLVLLNNTLPGKLTLTPESAATLLI